MSLQCHVVKIAGLQFAFAHSTVCFSFEPFGAFCFAAYTPVYAGDAKVAVKSKALAHYILAVSNDFNGRTVEAISEYERSIALNNQEVLPHLRLATYYLRLSLFDKAIKQLKDVLKLDPANSQGHYLLGLIYSSQKKLDLAAAEYEQILKTASHDNPENLEIYTYLAQLYFSQEKYNQAIEQFKHIIAVNPKNASAYYFLGSSYLETHVPLKAKECFQKALSIEPRHDGALNSLAFMQAEQGNNLDDALRMVRQAIDIDPANGAYYDTLGWVLFRKGMNKEALVALQKALVYVQDSIIFEHIGDVYYAIKEFALAYKNWQKSLDLDPNQARVRVKIQDIQKTQAFKAQM